MDSFSYCDISSVFVTKTIDRIISPMAIQLCHLVITLDCDDGKFMDANSDLGQMAEDVSKATEHFANTSVRLGEECDDGILRQEIEQAAKSLQVTGKNILLAVQKLCIQPNVRKHQEDLIIAAQNTLTGTLKILQLEDNANVRKIIGAVDWLFECLSYLQEADSISHLLSHFYEFSEALLLVNTLMERRILDMKDNFHQNHLSQTLQVLRKCVPMLYTATQSNLKHPHNEAMIASKLYIFDLTSKTLNELKSLLTKGPVKHELGQQQGSFSQEMCKLLHLLSNSDPNEISSSDFDFLVGCIVFYSMYVADCSRSNMKLQLVNHCKNLLDQRKKIWDRFNELQISSLGNHNKLEQQCDSMRKELGLLSQTLISTIFYQILDGFTIKDPLKGLLKAALRNNKKASFCPHNLIASKYVQLLQAFQNHTEKLLKMSNLVLAQCSQKRSIDEIHNSTDYLCRVRDEVIELIIDSNKESYDEKLFEKAQSVYQKWIQATESLMVSFDSMLTVHQFLDISIKEIEKNRHQCTKHLRNQDPKMFHYHAADLCDLAERVGQVINRHVDESKDPIYRNGLRVLVRQLERSVLEARDIMMACNKSFSCSATQTSFLEKVNKLCESLNSVKDGISGYNHPDLLSPLRTEAAPVRNKHITIDLTESDQANTCQKLREPKGCLSFEGYLSKPLPLIARPATINIVNTEKSRSILDLQPFIGDLLTAAKNHNMKEIHAYTSSVIELSRILLEESKESCSLEDRTEEETPRYKQVESLIVSLAQLTNKENPDSICVDRIIQTTVLLSHCTEDLKTYLVSLASYWFTFSQQLFCTSSIADIDKNVQIFNRTMQSLKRIVQSISDYMAVGQKDLDFVDSYEKQECLVKIQVQFYKCQAAANNLLTRVLHHRIEQDTHKKDDLCLRWSVAAQNLSKYIDDALGINYIFISESTDLRELKLSDCKSLIFLCEAALWLQEASALSLRNFTNDRDKKIVGLLSEEIDALTDSILKLKDEFNVSMSADLLVNINCLLLQKELKLKLNLLMYHIEKLYNGRDSLLHKVVSHAWSFKSTERSNIKENFEKSAKVLTDTVALIKDTINHKLCLEKKEDVAFLSDHLFFLTSDLIARTRLLIESYSFWEIFMLKAMSMNYFSKADQLIFHLQTDTDMDIETLTFIKQCLKMEEGTETPTTIDYADLENPASEKSIQLPSINLTEHKSVNETEGQHNESKDDRNETSGSGDISPNNSFNQMEHDTVDKRTIITLNNEQKTELKKSIKSFNSKQNTETQNKHEKSYMQKKPATFKAASQKTTITKTDQNISVYENKKVQPEMAKENTQTESKIPFSHTSVLQGPKVQNQIVRKGSGQLKRQVLPNAVPKEMTNIHSKVKRTNAKYAGILKCAYNEESTNSNSKVEGSDIQRKATNQRPLDQKTETEITIGENTASHQGFPNQNVPTKHIGPQTKETNLESSDLKIDYVFCEDRKDSTNQESVIQKAPPECADIQTEIFDKGLESKVVSGEQNKPKNIDLRKHEMHRQKKASQEPCVIKSPPQTTLTDCDSNEKTHIMLTEGLEEPTSLELIKSKKSTPISEEQNDKVNQASENHETLTRLSEGQMQTTDEETHILKAHPEHVGLQTQLTTQNSENKTTSIMFSEGHDQSTDKKSIKFKKFKEVSEEQDEPESQEPSNTIKHMASFTEQKMPTNQKLKSQITPDYAKSDYVGLKTKLTKIDSTRTKTLRSVQQKTYLPTLVRHDTILRCLKGSTYGKIYKSLNQVKMANTQDTFEAPTAGSNEIRQESKFSTSAKQLKKEKTSFVKPHPHSNEVQKERAGQLSERHKAKIAVARGQSFCVYPDQSKNTAVIMEHHKEGCMSLEDVHWQPNRMATCLLAEEVETWEGEVNTIVKITREMAAQMSYMIQYLNREGPIQTPEQLIASAKCIAAHGLTFVKFVGIIAKNCTDERNASDLVCGMEQIQTISNQLSIVSSVKAATGCDDYSAEDVLLKNAQNLIHSVLITWKAAEAACIKSSEQPANTEDEEQVAAFCSQMRKQLICQRAKELRTERIFQEDPCIPLIDVLYI